jgi:hypothetical protein
MKSNLSPLGVATLALAATFLQAASPAPQARITLVEHDAAPGAKTSPGTSFDPSVATKVVPGMPVRQAHLFLEKIPVGSTRTEIVEVAFHAKTTIQKIDAINDFYVVPGGTCRENTVYNEGGHCTVDVAFKGMGPGKRAGLLNFHTAESVRPETIGLQGATYGPALAFTPALITTLPQSLDDGNPILYAPGDVAVDQGDNLYISDSWVGADTASGKIYFLDAGNNLTTIAGGGANTAANKVDDQGGLIDASTAFLNLPAGIAPDSWLDLYIAESGYNTIDQYSQTQLTDAAGLGATFPGGADCLAAKPCNSLSISLLTPYWVATDDNDNVFFDDGNGYYSATPGTVYKASNVTYLPEWYYIGLDSGQPFNLDSQDNLFATRDEGLNICQIEGWDSSSNFAWAAVGSQECGSAGNNVRAQNAEIGVYISGFANDPAGDMYFADYYNNVLRRVDNYNGLIHTVAGNPALPGNDTGDGGPATQATLNGPVGIAVNSNGVIYTASFVAGASPSVPALKGKKPASVTAPIRPERCIENCGPVPTAVIRQIGPDGQSNFPTTLVGKSSPVNTILLTNVGNDYLAVTRQILGGPDAGDFAADPLTSSCNWTNALAPGLSCQLGYQCIPKAGGLRTATVYFVDNTATFQNQLHLSCYAIAAPATPKIVVNPPAAGASYPYLENVPVTVTVSNTLPVNLPPTGTVLLTVTNVATSKVVQTIGPAALSPTGGVGASSVGFTIAGGTNLTPGKYSIVANYTGDTFDTNGASAADTFSVTSLNPTITWEPPSEIAVGAALSSAYLNATATVNGSFIPGVMSYSLPPSATVICSVNQVSAAAGCTPSPAVDTKTAGPLPIKVVFAPTYAIDYNAVTETQSITVVAVGPATAKHAPAGLDNGPKIAAPESH